MALRVCMVVHHYFPRDVRVRREALALAEAGMDVSVVCLRLPGQPARENWRGIEIFRQAVHRHRGSPLPVYLAEYMAQTALAGLAVTSQHMRRRFDVVHVHTPPDFLAAAGVLARLGGARLFLDVHDLSPELYGTRFAGRGAELASSVLSAIEQGAGGIANQVITVTEVFRRALVERGMPESKVAVVHNYPDEGLFSPSAGDGPELSDDIFRIVHHGTLMHRYGIDVLLSAFELVAAELPQARLDIYGEGDLQPALERQRQASAFAERIELHGDVAQDTLGAMLERAHLCVVPNRSDPFTDLLLPTKLLEALRMGAATIASDSPVIRDEIPAGAVHLVNPGSPPALAQAILYLARDDQKRKELARTGKAAAKSFSWNQEKEKLLALYLD